MKKNHDVIILIATNLVAIVMAVIYGWDATNVLFIYWCQSIIIGIFTYFKLMSFPVSAYAKEMVEGASMTINGVPVTDPVVYKRSSSGFFLLHYGLFHVGYLVFILAKLKDPGTLLIAAIPVGLFAANHFYSYLVNKEQDIASAADNPTATFWKPYLRIIPMHITIIVAAQMSGTATLVVFMIIKTLEDVVLHKFEHYIKSIAPPATIQN